MTILLMRVFIRVTSALFLASFCAHAAAAQFSDKDVYSRREILTAAPLSADSARNSCVILGSTRWTPNVFELDSCRALRCSAAGNTPTISWIACEYEHHWISAASGSQPADTLREIEVVLYRTPAKQRAAEGNPPAAQQFTPVWQEFYMPEFLRSVTPSVTSVEGGGLLLAIQECVDGTGGCGQSFLLNRGKSWHPLKLAFLDSVEHGSSVGFQNKFHVDPVTLTAEVWIYSDKDANCCPSRSAVISLRLRGDTLEAKTIRIKRL